ncbi:acyltransferase [Bacillus sp. V3B]|uniref:acyltransferase n=1 Tax=Bacillus sp. V3B TaxID=2804915 RepID=UPI00210BDBF3|nr:acyltransferase [Bacillus sp. V3B]MCQ6276847.1 acyltransferase [Bacillus sp. V3B]
MEKKHYYSIDLLKFFAIIFVVCIHSNPFIRVKIYEDFDINFFIDVFARFAVPVFFVTSGFLIGQKILEGKNINEYFNKYTWKIVTIFLSWTAFYFIYDILVRLNSYRQTGEKTEIEKYINRFFSLDTLWYTPNGTPYHLWYLVALIWSLIILYFFIKHKKLNLLLVLSLGFNLVGLLGQSYSVIFDLSKNTREALFFATFYLTLGYWIGFNLNKIRGNLLRVNPLIYLWLFFIFSGLQILESVLLVKKFGFGRAENYYLSTVFLVVSLFLFALTKPNIGKGSWLSKVGKNSLGIYVIHVFFINLIRRLLPEELLFIRETFWWHLLYTPALIVISYFAYEIIQIVKRRIKNRTSHKEELTQEHKTL